MCIKKACCGFGHREVFENITEEINKAVLVAVEQGCEVFYTGAMGRFDEMFSSAVRRLKKGYPNIKLICVKPYFSKDINENGDYLYSLYDGNYSEPPSNSQKPILSHNSANNILPAFSVDC